MPAIDDARDATADRLDLRRRHLELLRAGGRLLRGLLDRLHRRGDVLQTRELLAGLHEQVCILIDKSIASLVSGDELLAEEVIRAKGQVNRLSQEAEKYIALRLTADEPNRVATFRLETEMIEYLKRMYYFAKRIAKLVSGLDEPSRVSPDLSPGLAG